MDCWPSPVPSTSSLAKLKQTVRRGSELTGRGDLLHPYLQVAVNLLACRYATERTGREQEPINADDVARAAEHLAATAKPMRGRPRARLVDHHVAGLMALIQESCGTAVTAIRETSSGGYGPRLVGVGRVLLPVLGDIDPTITETQLANKVLELRRTYAGKLMRFSDFYPLYGVAIGSNCEPIIAPNSPLKSFQRIHPIYCR